MAAVCEAKLGRVGEARTHADQALALAPADADTLHSAAVVSAISGRRREAVDRLVRALDHGASVVTVQHDDELASIRQDPRVVAKLTRKEPTGGSR